MQNPFATPTASNLGFLALRVSLGAYFTIAGYNKIIGGITTFVEKNLKSVPDFVKPPFGELYLTLLPPIEVLVGLALVAGFLTRTASFLSALMLISFIYAVTGVSEAGKPFHANLIFLSAAIMLLTNGGGTYTLPNILGKKGGAKPPAPAPGK